MDDIHRVNKIIGLTMNKGVININAFWDDEASVYVATSDDVPGLVTEADSIDHLVEKLKCMIPELLVLNADSPKQQEDIPFKVVTEVNAIAHAC